MKWKFSATALLITTCIYYFIFAVTFIHPANLVVRDHGKSTYGKQDRHILRVWRMAKDDAKKSFSEVKDHGLFHKRNPGLFKFIAELCIRAGMQSPIPLQILLIFMVILGIIAQHIWLKEYFKHNVFPVVGNLFILGTHFLTFFGSTIHQHPYNFAFFNFSLFAIVRFVQTKKEKYFVLAWFCYFFLCQNYYMFWVSTFVMMSGVLYFSGKNLLNLRSFILGLAPVFTVILLLIQVAYCHGSLKKGFSKVEEAAKARMVDDIADKDAHFKKKMDIKDWITYPFTVSSRVERYFYIPGMVFLGLFLFLIFKFRPSSSPLNYKFFYFLIPAGLSWYFLMFQHTSVHVVSGRYSYFLWMIFLGYFFYEVQEKLKGKSLKAWAKYIAIFVLVYGVYGFGYINSRTLVMNFYRLGEYYSLKSDAENGNEEAKLRLFSNKFAKAYGMLDEGWLIEFSRDGKSIGSDIQYLASRKYEDEIYVLLESSHYQYRVFKKLFINNKYIDITYPNETEIYFGSDRFTVLKLRKIDQIEEISLR